MKIFITGGDGLLGSNLVRELLQMGHELRVLVQPNRKNQTLEGLPILKVEGDLLDFDRLVCIAEGCEAIYHVAANTSIWPSRNTVVNRVNIAGTMNIISLAKKLKVKKMVYVGTANSFSFGSKEKPGVEGSVYIARKYGLDYLDSKYEAHQLVMDAVKDGVPAVVVNPTFMLGPFDSMPSSGAMVLAVYQQKIPGFAPGGRNYICVKDAAKGIANALEKGRIGECYIIGNKNLSYKEAFTMMAKVLGVKPPALPMPAALVLMYGVFNMILYRLTGKRPLVSYPMSRIACDRHYFSAAKAVRELDLPQSPIEDGVRDCFHWLHSNGYSK